MNALKSINELQKIAAILGGMPIIGIMEGSPAGQQGLRYGDILIRLGEHPISDVASFVKARCLFEDELPVSVIRDGQELHLVLDLSNDRIPKST